MSLDRCLVVLCLALFCYGNEEYLTLKDGLFTTQTCRSRLQTVAMNEHCSSEVRLEQAMIIVPTRHPYFVLPTCMNCSVTLVASLDQQIVSTLYLLGTEVSKDDKCSLNRLDIYDGENVDDSHLLSGKGGICGCKMPAIDVFKSSNNTMTIHFQTICEQTHTQHGELELVVSAVKNDMFNVTECHGEFECRDGGCIDKNLVCNGEYDCADHSDEIGCHMRNGTCPGEFECLNGSCIDKNLVCNGQKDCPDGSDETDCHRHDNSTCAGKFECKNGQCIDKNKVCNGENDCKDKSDETGCHTKISRLLLYILIGLAGFIVLLLIVVVIVLCCRYCCVTFRMASAYRRLS